MFKKEFIQGKMTAGTDCECGCGCGCRPGGAQKNGYKAGLKASAKHASKIVGSSLKS